MADYSNDFGADHPPGNTSAVIRLAPSQVVNEATAVSVCAHNSVPVESKETNPAGVSGFFGTKRGEIRRRQRERWTDQRWFVICCANTDTLTDDAGCLSSPESKRGEGGGALFCSSSFFVK